MVLVVEAPTVGISICELTIPQPVLRYIDALMNAAKQKKLQDELRDERQAQKEREREGAEFSDKDVFVTGA